MTDKNLTIPTYSQMLAKQGKSLANSKPLGAVVADMLQDDEANGSVLFNETALYLDDTPDPDTDLKFNGAGCLGFAKAEVTLKWKAKYSKQLIGYNCSNYTLWGHINNKLKKAGVLQGGKTAPAVKLLIAEAKAAQLTDQSGDTSTPDDADEFDIVD